MSSKADSGEHDRVRESDALGPGLIHEMRHPLLGIKAGLELLARDLGAKLTALDDWELVTSQVARLEELFKSYQQLYSPPAEAARFAVEPVVQRATDLLAWRLRRLGARFEWQRDGSHTGHASPSALLHATINLLANAIDAVEETKGRVAVRVLAAPLEVRVSDEGAGVADERRLFEANYTTKKDGTGLGLHIARTAMARAGGDVRLAGAQDPRRLPWAKTEFVVAVPE